MQKARSKIFHLRFNKAERN